MVWYFRFNNLEEVITSLSLKCQEEGIILEPRERTCKEKAVLIPICDSGGDTNPR